VFYTTQAAQQVAKKLYESKVQPTTLIPRQVGNMYTASLYAAFASVIHNRHETLVRYYVQFFLLFLQDKMISFDVNLDVSTVFVLLLTCPGRTEDRYVFLWKWVDIDNVFFQD
jgi:hypothetical protein